MTKPKEKKTLFEHLGLNSDQKVGKINMGMIDKVVLMKTLKSLIVFLLIGFIIGLIIEMFIPAPTSIIFLLIFAIIWLYKKYGDDIF